MSLSGIFGRIVALIGAAAILWRRREGARARAGFGQHSGDPGGKAAGHPDPQDADGQGVEPRGRRRLRRPGSRSMRLRPVSGIPAGSTCCPMATCSSPRP